MATFVIVVLVLSFTCWFIYKMLQHNADEYERYEHRIPNALKPTFGRPKAQHVCVYHPMLTWRKEDPDTVEQVQACNCGKIRGG